jgi:phosphoenolpyruvate carboxylase
MNVELQAEVKHLTGRLDAIIREQAGEILLRRFQTIRKLSTAGRALNDRASIKQKRRLIDALSIESAYHIAHAFSLYFQLVNICEERARIRHLRGAKAPAMSLRKLFADLKAARVKAPRLQAALDELEIQPVLTAHPTEAKRRAVLNQLNRLTASWDHPDEVLEALWQTQEVRERGVGPLQEVESAVFYFEHAIFETVADFYTEFDAALKQYYPNLRRTNNFLTFASWVGGDRDGNPFVTPEVSRTTAQRHAGAARRFYERECKALVAELTHASVPQGKSQVSQFPETSQQFQPYEELRQKIASMRRGLQAGELDVESFISGLEEVQSKLKAQKAYRSAAGRIDRLIKQARTFGFHLAELDFRDHSGKLNSAEDELVEEFRAIKQIQREHGELAANHFVLSMTRDANDILQVKRLAEQAGVDHVDFVPLFETIHDLEQSGSILCELWKDSDYRKHLARRGNVQEVMVGYSDSNKDGGYLAANWFLYRSQNEMSRLATEHGIKLRLFHGKGGTIDRGGGASHRSLLAQPHAAQGGRIRITEQGEVISLKYSNPAIARRNLEQLTSAVIASQCLPEPAALERKVPRWEGCMEKLARRSFEFYQQLVYGTPEFLEYFREATPIDLIEHVRLGSRPARRAQSADIRQLRAIPWVFAWTQSRHLLSAWYGVGSALEQFITQEPNGLSVLREMYAHWSFFSQVLDNAEMSLAKADLTIAREYASLVHNSATREKIFGMIEEEHRRSIALVLKVTGRNTLLEKQPVLAQSIRRRNPFVDPLNYLQIAFLSRWRKGPESRRTELFRKLLALTVNGIAFGMKSTG